MDEHGSLNAALERQSPIPLYYQLKQLLAARITAGELKPDDMLPTEEELQEQYGLSRTTVRQALRELELEGLITRFRGRGTFVAKPKLSHGLAPHRSLTQYLRDQGAVPGWRVLSSELRLPPGEVAQALAVPAGANIFYLERLRLADDEPIGYHMAYVAPLLIPYIDMTRLASGGSLAYLEGSGRLEKSKAHRIIEAVAAPEEIADLLEIDAGSPMLSIRRTTLSPTGVPFEYMRALYRGDRLQYHIV
ncbi:MAG: GntR family transcriptional regulator [Caldilineaceae bacterium]|nr:GntR family transcriptional regulator [Caldilineaceae bacterium]